MQTLLKPVRRVLALAGFALTVSAVACGTNPGSPSPAPNIFGHATILTPTRADADLARCLGGSGDSACFSAGRLQQAAVRAATVTSSPLNLMASVNGSTAFLSWTQPPIQESPVLSYVVEAGSGPGQINLANFNTGTSQTDLTVPGVPAGIYFVRIRALNASGASAPSNEVVLTVGAGPSCASAPQNLTASSSGTGLVSLQWAAPITAGVLSYVIQAGSSPGRSDLANFDTGSAALGFDAGGVANGAYYVRVYARSGCGLSAASNEALLVVGPPAPSINIAGPWRAIAESGIPGLTTFITDLNLTQTGNQITGTVRTVPFALSTYFMTTTLIGTVESVAGFVSLQNLQIIGSASPPGANWWCSGGTYSLRYAAGPPRSMAGVSTANICDRQTIVTFFPIPN